MLTHEIYYLLKPLIPRPLQIYLRRRWVSRKRLSYTNIWPIEEKAGRVPEGWPGWPDGKRFALVLTHDVETPKGRERCVQLAMLEESLNFQSSFNFVAEEYKVSALLRSRLAERGFEIGIHGLYHGKNPFRSKKLFQKQAVRINQYLKEWGSVGYRCPCMYHNLEWISDLDIEYDSSTFDTDPFEPQPDGVSTIFPFWVPGNHTQKGYIELPYTLPQDHTLFVIMGERDITIWKKKLDWIVERGGMALLIVHPDYMNLNTKGQTRGEYPATYFTEFLEYIKNKYEGQFWHVLPKEMARFWAKNYVNKKG
jgi:peptidoglycan/xylan/chitin deacetylase (PgdA/CDA1 family)